MRMPDAVLFRVMVGSLKEEEIRVGGTIVQNFKGSNIISFMSFLARICPYQSELNVGFANIR